MTHGILRLHITIINDLYSEDSLNATANPNQYNFWCDWILINLLPTRRSGLVGFVGLSLVASRPRPPCAAANECLISPHDATDGRMRRLSPLFI